MGLSQDQIDAIRLAGVIHNLGKISIYIEILTYLGKLGDREMAMIKRHPQIGYEILKIIDFPWPIAQIVRQHHELMDGSGYPLGLTGIQIMPEARILCVADVVEAMVSHRPYRSALGLERTLDEITRNRGTLYDAMAVDTALKLLNEEGSRSTVRSRTDRATLRLVLASVAILGRVTLVIMEEQNANGT
jgi:putative two-component system response regulator